MKIFRLFSCIFVFLLVCCGNSSAEVRDGDIIFQTSLSSQSLAIQLATHSKYSHMGVIFFIKNKPYVFEAGQTVQYTPLKQWIESGEGGRYVIKRLRDADRVMTPQAITKIKAVAQNFQGTPYDHIFKWSDDHMYCSELVWKIYDRGLGIEVGQPKKLRDFDLSNDIVQMKLKERYGNNIPLTETVISPGDMFSSGLLQTISEK